MVPKTPLDRLVNLVEQIPALAARGEQGSVGGVQGRAWVELRCDGRRFLSDLTAWFGSVVRPGVDGFLNSASSPACTILAISKTHTMLVYWTACLLARSVLQQVLAGDEIPANAGLHGRRRAPAVGERGRAAGTHPEPGQGPQGRGVNGEYGEAAGASLMEWNAIV